ncbi:MAG TPA: DJ-1/PfpI family protein [Candidatus Aquicultor sp.]|jgi:protease I
MSISGKEVALIIADNFDSRELNSLRRCFDDAGALISVIGDVPERKLQDFEHTTQVEVEISYEQARGYNFQAVIIPDGYSPDRVRMNDAALDLVLDMFNTGKIVGAIDHGVQVLITLGVLKGKNVTGSPSIRVDVENAGANYYDEPVVVDGNLITCKGPENIKEFCDTVITEINRSSEAAA